MGGAVEGWGGGGVELDPEFHVVGQADETRFSVATKTVTDTNIRCQGQVPVPHETGEFKVCGKLLALKAGRPWSIQCPRCKQLNLSAP